MDIAKILKGAPKGTKLYSPIFGDVIFGEMRQDYIRVRTNNIIREFYPDGRYYANGECMLFPSRENRDWYTFKINSFKKGDILISRSGKPFIFKEVINNICESYCGIDNSDVFWEYSDFWTPLDKVRKATEKEIDLFFERLRKEGFKWNSNTLTLEKLEDKFDITTLKPFDKVLARDGSSYKWVASFFSHLKDIGFKFVCSSDVYQECIPYNDETKHLIGTNKDCPEYYKTW